MPRPEFAPSTNEQKTAVGRLDRLITRQGKLSDEIRQAIINADSHGVPVAVIAKKMKMDRKTVYGIVGRPIGGERPATQG